MSVSTVSHALLDWAKAQGVRHVFLVPGSQIEPLCQALVDDAQLQPIVACHELGAGFMADGYAQVRRGVGIAASSGGPGALYFLPSAVIARVERSSVLYVTGDAPRWLEGRYYFQNTQSDGTKDQMLFGVGTGLSVRVQYASQFRAKLETCGQALEKAMPAHLVLPVDLQSDAYGDVLISSSEKFHCAQELAAMRKLAIHWNRAQSPLLVLGHRLTNTTDPAIIQRLIEKCGVPVATTYGAKGLVPDSHPLSLGNFGYGGTKASQRAICDEKHDLVLVIGANLGQREAFDQTAHFKKKHRALIRVDINPSVSHIGLCPDEEIHVDTFPPALEVLIHEIETRSCKLSAENRNWYAEDQPSLGLLDDYLKLSQEILPPDTVLFVDAGRHRLCAGRSWRIQQPGTFYSSPDQAPMGWGIAASIGGKLARPSAPFLVLTGDGCMRMHGQELAVAARYKIPLIILVANNSGYGSIAARERNQKHRTELGDLPKIDWVQFASALGATGCRVEQREELKPALQQALSSPGPFVIDLVLPSVAFEQAGFAQIWPSRTQVLSSCPTSLRADLL